MTTAPYQLTIDGFAADHVRVHSLEGNETISEAWWFDVVATATAGDDVERAALAQRATLIFNVHENPRAFYGIVSSVRVAEVHAVDHAVKYVVRVVPRLWLLRRKTRSRVFQKMRVPDIVSAVLLEAGIATRWQLVRAYPEREYCTQYEETDYRFVRRILAEAGIYFYFFGGGPVSAAALAADAAMGAAASAGGSVAAFAGGSAVGGLIGAAAQMAETLIPGDTIIGADDASCYPPVGGDDAGALAASTAAAMAPAIGDVIGMGGGVAGAAFRAASAMAGTVIADLTEGARGVPALHFMANEAAKITTHDKVTRFTLRNTVRSTGAAFRDYDPDRPMVRLQSVAVSTQPFPPSPFEIAAEAAAAAESMATTAGGLLGGPAAGALGTVSYAVATVDSVAHEVGAALGQKVPYEVYQHHSPFLFPKWELGSDEAPRILRQKRRRASIAEGEGGCSDFAPAHRFTIEDHPAGQLDGAYVVTTVEHRGETHPSNGEAWRVYWNTFECAPAQMPYVPPRPKRKSIQVSLTATVVGPEGEEIHVDEKGQIKVQFHWDREGKHDQNSSCWIRAMQPWAGAAWGHQFIPRVGMEVVVVFEGGDPDKPMVLGSLYNGTHPPAFQLPADKTRSGIRTQSSPGGGGFNELSFEDASGREQIYVHAQRNLDEKVEKNHTLLVRNDEFLRIIGERIDTIEKNLTEHVMGDHASQVDGNRVDLVSGNRDDRVSGMLVTRVEGKERRDVRGATDLEYADDLTTRVEGCVTTLVGKPDKKRAWVTHAEGIAALSGLDQLKLSSDKELVLGVGKSSIRITANGIELNAARISVKGGGSRLSASDDGLSLSSKGDAQLVVGKRLVLKTSGASVALDKEVKIDGQQILLNSPEQATDAPPRDPDPPTKVELRDDEGNALGYQRFLIKTKDEAEVSGLTDKDGKAEIDLKSDGKVIFPDVTMPGDDAVKAKMMPYIVRQGDHLTKLAFIHGFDALQVWNDPKNAAVKAQRKSPNILHPGDIVYLPRAKREGLPLQKGTTNTYQVKVPKMSVSLTFNDEKGPLANEPYVVEGLGEHEEGSTDGAGKLTLQVPVHLREIHVAFPGQNIGYPVRIGDLDPIDEPAGVRERLQHLGHHAPPSGEISEADMDERDRRSIAAFQEERGLPVTGVADDATKAEIIKVHGC